ncbi:hypothetical protein [Phytohabitans rumicis]|uniref:MurNAc-LAA domain-containing protein n=1 Tax=Phytohabitans rumicis TaxID=1076125 RepID=A0A6V8LJ82_9ACTN|nr:hypothetical protein [Phytohabitans rumicis]GFJ96274.1 hypothetical protein Prum_099160 [Phytohabitans rumicis]
MNMTPVRRAAASAAAIAIAGLGIQAVPAPALANPEDGGQHCVARVTTGTPEAVCFDTFAEALSRASGGRLTYGPKNAEEAARTPGFAARVNAANAANRVSAAAGYDTVLSIHYTASNWGGSDLIWVGTSNCSTSTNNTDYEIDTMPAGWVNVITSYLTFANCWVQHWEDTFQGGDHVGYHGSRSYIGSTMDNRTSSLRWS